MIRIRKIAATVMMVTVLLASLAGCGSKDKVTVGAKNYTESLLTGEIIAQLLEAKTDLKIERKYNLSAAVSFEAIKSGEIDIVPEYTGSALIHYLKKEPITDPDESYRVVKEEYEKQFGLVWLEDFGFNNTYANAVRKDFAEANGIKTFSDLAPFTPELIFGAEHGYLDRTDGYYPMCELYGYDFKDTLQMDVGLIYKSLNQGEVDVANVYTTDGLLYEYDLVVLEDDKNFYPSYYCAPVVRQDTLTAHPEIAETLQVLKDCTTAEDMVRYNYMVDGEKLSIEKVAATFIEEKGLLK
ncbi:glycine betaine ABC transporter substrate-binding protein [Oscillospiraceae bacterium MB08-C2-2]|nr:glycine betaine ABC transporter substrate-binding protein [Oscillospiraceae bacterium MB08-C2-2]